MESVSGVAAEREGEAVVHRLHEGTVLSVGGSEEQEHFLRLPAGEFPPVGADNAANVQGLPRAVGVVHQCAAGQ